MDRREIRALVGLTLHACCVNKRVNSESCGVERRGGGVRQTGRRRDCALSITILTIFLLLRTNVG